MTATIQAQDVLDALDKAAELLVVEDYGSDDAEENKELLKTKYGKLVHRHDIGTIHENDNHEVHVVIKNSDGSWTLTSTFCYTDLV